MSALVVLASPATAKHVAAMHQALLDAKAFQFQDSPLLSSWYDFNDAANTAEGLDLGAPDEMALHARWESEGEVFDQVITVGDLIKARLKGDEVVIPSDGGDIVIQAFSLGPVDIDPQELIHDDASAGDSDCAVAAHDDVYARRSKVADSAYEAHIFGPHMSVKGQDGWEYTTPGTSMSRTVYIEADGVGDGLPSEKVTFTVVFAANDSAELAQAFAINAQGNLVGHQGASEALNDAQRLFLDTYSNGDFAELASIESSAERKNAIEQCGDTLLRFFMAELASSEDCHDLATAVDRIDQVHRQVLQLAEVFEAASAAQSLRPSHGG